MRHAAAHGPNEAWMETRLANRHLFTNTFGCLIKDIHEKIVGGERRPSYVEGRENTGRP